jgi:hypothetical protein
MLGRIFGLLQSETARNRCRYDILREETNQYMLSELSPFIGESLTDITDIDAKALTCWERQWRPNMPSGKSWSDWNWPEDSLRWEKHIDRLSIAVWSGEQLCGLALGKPSQARNNLSIYLLQGSPVESHALKGKVLPIVIDVASAYGTALGCRELRLVKPLSGMVGKYQDLGFQLEKDHRSAPYCVRSL